MLLQRNDNEKWNNLESKVKYTQRKWHAETQHDVEKLENYSYATCDTREWPHSTHKVATAEETHWCLFQCTSDCMNLRDAPRHASLLSGEAQRLFGSQRISQKRGRPHASRVHRSICISSSGRVRSQRSMSGGWLTSTSSQILRCPSRLGFPCLSAQRLWTEIHVEVSGQRFLGRDSPERLGASSLGRISGVSKQRLRRNCPENLCAKTSGRDPPRSLSARTLRIHFLRTLY